jgi:hypothetical protein
MIERSTDFIDAHAVLLLQMQQDAGINRAAASRHHQAIERRESHRRIDAATMPYGGSRATMA